MNERTLPNKAEQIKSGNKEALEQLFKAYYQALCRYAMALLHDKSAAEDVVQDLFLNLWKNRKKLARDTRWQSYLYGAVHHNAMQYIRHKKVVMNYDSTITKDQRKATNPIDPIQEKELREAIEQTLQQLPEKTRNIFALSRFQGLKYAEIAAELAVSVKTVEAHMGKALKAFRQNLSLYLTN